MPDDSDNRLDDSEFEEVIRGLDKEQLRIIIRVETRRFRKPTTLINGLGAQKNELDRVSHNLKKKLATGGTAKDGIIILQGDHREAAKAELVKMGYPDSNIEVQ